MFTDETDMDDRLLNTLCTIHHREYTVMGNNMDLSVSMVLF